MKSLLTYITEEINSKTNELFNWLKKSGQKEFTNPKKINNEWVVHFGQVDEILKAGGFTLGEPEFEKLTNTDSYDKEEKGFDFAWKPNDITPLAQKACVGEQAILFRTSGIVAKHVTDTEPSNEVIFWGEDADLSEYYTFDSDHKYREWIAYDKDKKPVKMYVNKWGDYTSLIPFNDFKKTVKKFVKENLSK